MQTHAKDFQSHVQEHPNFVAKIAFFGAAWYDKFTEEEKQEFRNMHNVSKETEEDILDNLTNYHDS